MLLGWYPRTKLEMDEASRTREAVKFGGVKYVYPTRHDGRAARLVRAGELAERLPEARRLYWT